MNTDGVLFVVCLLLLFCLVVIVLGWGVAVELRAWFHDALWSDTFSSPDLESMVHFTE